MKKHKFDWPSRAVRDDYFLNLHFRVLRIQYQIMQELLNENPALKEEFKKRWQDRDLVDTYVLAQDPEYDEWFREE